MKIADARYLADCLIDTTFTINGRKYCARDIGYSFAWMNRKRTLGLCNYSKKQILLSEDYVFNNNVELVKDTILHELAHAFSYHIYGSRGHGHNQYWRSVCVQIGALPNRCKSTDDGLKVDYAYVLRHKETKEVYSGFHKWPSKTANRISEVWIRGKKWETLGKLEIVSA
jgi:predicted SprT family Zn-dependent metalloprotease